MGKWVVVGNSNCPYCDKVKKLLDSYRISYEYFSLDPHSFQSQGYQGPNSFMLRQFIKAVGYETVPVVFWNKVWVGGYQDTLLMLRSEMGEAPID